MSNETFCRRASKASSTTWASIGASNFQADRVSNPNGQRIVGSTTHNSVIAADPEITRVMQLLEGGRFNEDEPGIFSLLTSALRNPHDQWLTIADFRSYIDAQREVNKTYLDPTTWRKQSIINVASSGWFSSDRTIRQYADEIWGVKPVD